MSRIAQHGERIRVLYVWSPYDKQIGFKVHMFRERKSARWFKCGISCGKWKGGKTSMSGPLNALC